MTSVSSKFSDCCMRDAMFVTEVIEEELHTKHKKERKNLQAEIQKLKHGVPKGDKKKKKEVAEEIAKLEADLDAKHAEELASLKSKSQAGELNEVCKEDAESTVPTGNAADEDFTYLNGEGEGSQSSGRKSKAQKRRDKKQAKTKEREEVIREQAVQNRLGPRHQETIKIKEQLKERGFTLHEIPADGNCLYNALGHQLQGQNIQSSNEELRQKTADYMRKHMDDFLPFLTHPDTGDMLTPEEFESYCVKTANSPAWGGQIELRALSEVLQQPIEVIQADSKPMVIGENLNGKPLTVVYHRHVFRLGEHYNSVSPVSQVEENDANEEEGDSLT